MTAKVTLRLAGSAFILLAATAAGAVTLGRAQSAALIGRPLEASIAVNLDGVAADATCPEAEVFYGDSRVDPSLLTVRLVTSGGAPTILLRAAKPVDEPVVTLYVRVGCDQRLMRRYVVLSEQPADLPEPVLPPVAGPATAPPAAAGARVGGLAPAAAGAGVAAAPSTGAPAREQRARARSAATPVAPAPQAAPASAAASAPLPQASAPPRAARPPREPRARREAASQAAVPAARARLKLEPLDLGTERDPSLRLSNQITLPQEDGGARRAEAAALWRALNADPQEQLQGQQRVQTLENDLKSLREGLKQSGTELTQLRGELEAAKAERDMRAWLFAAGAALLVALLAAALWWRERRAVPLSKWWGGRADSGLADSELPAEPRRWQKPDAGDVPASSAVSEEDSDLVDLDLNFSPSVMDKLAPRPAPAADPAMTTNPGLRPMESLRVSAEELSDVQQQADFFVSLGEHEQAIEVLRGHIQSKPDASAVAWLDLLEIYHSLDRRDDFENTRAEFERVFNAHVPAFDAYRLEARGLEDYPQALGRIQALWPSPKVLEVIEESIFRRPGRMEGEAFGLQAYRELLLLHSVGTELAGLQEAPLALAHSGETRPTGFSHTEIRPLSASLSTEPALLSFPSIGLDINLDEPPPHLQEPMAVAGPDPSGGEESGFSNLLDFDLGEDDPTLDLTPRDR